MHAQAKEVVPSKNTYLLTFFFIEKEWQLWTDMNSRPTKLITTHVEFCPLKLWLSKYFISMLYSEQSTKWQLQRFIILRKCHLDDVW